MTNRICYQVTATLPDETTAASYIRWLQGGHVQAVIEGGADRGMVVRLDQEQPGDAPRVRAEYEFPSRQAYDRYVETAAPALREDGIRRFGSVPGVSFSRSLGEIL